MGKKKGKKGKNKGPKTESEIFLQQLNVIVAARLKEEKWALEDALDKKMKKKLTKKDKARIAAKRAEELKQAVEIERIRLIEEEKKRLEQERLDAIEKEHRDRIEQDLRVQQLGESYKMIRKFQNQWLKRERKDNQQAGWEQYLKCDGLPDPSNCGEMNTYLHLWDKVKENTLQTMAVQKTNEVLQLLDTLDTFLDSPAILSCKRDDWVTIRNRFREYQQYNLDCLAYRLLRDITNNLDRLNIPTARKLVVHPAGVFTVCVWALVQLPIPLPNPKRPQRPATRLAFSEICNLEVAFPKSIDVWAQCVRVMYVTYDHFSHKCDSFYAPRAPEGLNLNLAQVTAMEWEEKIKAKKEYREKVKLEREREVRNALAQAQTGEKEEDVAAAKLAASKQKEYIKVDASAIYLAIEDAQYAEFRHEMQTEVSPPALNLRKYRILGGVFFLDLFYQPPQPSKMVVSEITMSTLALPKWLNPVPFYYQFLPPPPAEPGVVRQPEEIEEEIKKIEKEYEELLHINLALPSNVVWLDPPVVCQWNSEILAWTTKDVHDAKHNEEKQTVQFKTGRFGPFAFAMYRYNCMPYQAWELKPLPGNKVSFTIMAAVLILEFTISGSQVALTQLQNAPSDALDSLIGKWLPFTRLKRILRKGGVDVFPAQDAFNYLESSSEKQWPMEQHVYIQMAQCCLYFNFSWSRWNFLAGRRTVVMQMRDIASQERAKQVGEEISYLMLMVTPLKALLVDCTEVSPTFIEEGIKKMKFYPDMYHLIIGISPVSMKCKLERTSMDLVNTVAELLLATRVLSLS